MCFALRRRRLRYIDFFSIILEKNKERIHTYILQFHCVCVCVCLCLFSPDSLSWKFSSTLLLLLVCVTYVIHSIFFFLLLFRYTLYMTTKNLKDKFWNQMMILEPSFVIIIWRNILSFVSFFFTQNDSSHLDRNRIHFESIILKIYNIKLPPPPPPPLPTSSSNQATLIGFEQRKQTNTQNSMGKNPFHMCEPFLLSSSFFSGHDYYPEINIKKTNQPTNNKLISEETKEK